MSNPTTITIAACEKCGGTDLITGVLDSHGVNYLRFIPHQKAIIKQPFAISATACQSCGALFDLKVNINDPLVATPEKKTWLDRIL